MRGRIINPSVAGRRLKGKQGHKEEEFVSKVLVCVFEAFCSIFICREIKILEMQLSCALHRPLAVCHLGQISNINR